MVVTFLKWYLHERQTKGPKVERRSEKNWQFQKHFSEMPDVLLTVLGQRHNLRAASDQ